jgi:hypothetical protein
MTRPPLALCVHRRHIKAAIAEISAFEAENFSARRTIAGNFDSRLSNAELI